MRQNKKQRNRLITSMLASMVALSALSQTNGERPQLVVEIIIDQLRSDYIELLQNHFGESGFNRLTQNGACFENVDFNIDNIDKVSATGMLVTGAYPRINGLSGAQVYDAQKHSAKNILTDPDKLGNFTSENLSPKALRVTTISDELKINGNGLGLVYSIAPDAQQAIVMAGHAGNGAFWINDVNGKWSTTTFYTDVPQAISTRNYKTPLAVRLDTMMWSPAMDLAKYPDIPVHKKYYPFRYVFPSSRKDRYSSYKKSALVNEEVTSVALDFLKSLNMGGRGETDMLNIAYTAAPFNDECGHGSVELQDIYLRLDKQLGRLFDAIDSSVGLQNTLVFVSSTGYFEDNAKTEDKYKLPVGEFTPSKAKSLLNLYLMAVYGNAQWVSDYYGETFYLNQKTVKEKNVDIKEVRKKASEFLRRMSGVAEAFSIDEIIDNPLGENAKRIHNGLVPSNAGDVFIEIMPGWSVVENENTPNQRVKQVRANVVSTPMYILHPQVKSQKIYTPIDATLLAPTVSRLLRIRSPNAAEEKPIILE